MMLQLQFPDLLLFVPVQQFWFRCHFLQSLHLLAWMNLLLLLQLLAGLVLYWTLQGDPVGAVETLPVGAVETLPGASLLAVSSPMFCHLKQHLYCQLPLQLLAVLESSLF
jgi:hypothetical protein